MRPTNFFYSESDALRCYTAEGYSPCRIADKITLGVIRFGPPTPTAQERVVLDIVEGRYYLELKP